MRKKVHNALVWLINNNPHYSGLTINDNARNSLPENGVLPDIVTVETDDDIVSDDNFHLMVSLSFQMRIFLKHRKHT